MDPLQAFLEEHGYLVIRGAVEADVCDRMVQELFERAKQHLGVDRTDYRTWGVRICRRFRACVCARGMMQMMQNCV
jgi:hypothetical protein